MVQESSAATESHRPVQWKDARFQPAIDKIRTLVGAENLHCNDDPMIGMCVAATHRFIVI